MRSHAALTPAGIGHFNYLNGSLHHIRGIWRIGHID
jgi:hypothetical protein